MADAPVAADAQALLEQALARAVEETRPQFEAALAERNAAEAEFLADMAVKTDAEFVTAYEAAARAAGRAWCHEDHVARLLKLARLGVGG